LINFNFRIDPVEYEVFDTQHLYLKPNSIFKTKKIICDNYLYPCYFFKKEELYYISTSVYSLCFHIDKLSRDYRFQNHQFIQTTYRTIFKEIKRCRPKRRISSNEITEKKDMIDTSSSAIQNYITHIENLFPDYRHLLLMGGKDSQIIALAKKKSKWDILTSEPNCNDNQYFIDKNNINVENYIRLDNSSSNTHFKEEIISMDCFYDSSHLRYVDQLLDYKKKYNKIIIWMGTGADGILNYNKSFIFDDWFDFWQFHVGMSSGIQHSAYKNLLNCPVLSPYQSDTFNKEFFFKYDREKIIEYGDLRPHIAESIYGKNVFFPKNNFTPPELKRSRFKNIDTYISSIQTNITTVKRLYLYDLIYRCFLYCISYVDMRSKKNRGAIGYILFKLRKLLIILIPRLKVRRYTIKEF